MARKLRVEYPGAIYHVLNRRDGQEAIFRDDRKGSTDSMVRFRVFKDFGWFAGCG